MESLFKFGLEQHFTTTSSAVPGWLEIVSAAGQGFGGIASAIFTGVAVWVAVRGLSTWREQQRAEFESQHAFELIGKIGVLSSAFVRFRSLGIREGETFDTQLSALFNADKDLIAAGSPFFVLWEEDFKELILGISNQTWKLAAKARQFQKLPQEPMFAEQRKELFEYISFQPGFPEEEDTVWKAFDSDATRLTLYLYAILEKHGRVGSPKGRITQAKKQLG
jgi:hypothetical protein